MNEIKEKKGFVLRRNDSTNGWYFKYEDIVELRKLLQESLPYEYSLIELDNLLNELFLRGIIK